MPFIVITGASGHVGANLVRASLAHGDPVRALVHNDRRALEGLDIEFATGDLMDPVSLRSAFDGADIVYHAAAHISISNHERQILETVNVLGTRNVVEACLQCGVSRLVHFSSIEALVDEPLNEPVDETRSLVGSRNSLEYALSKARGERYVQQGMAHGLDAVILYPTAMLGPYDYRLGYPNAGLLALSNGSLWALVEGGFNWVDVRDVVEGAVKAALYGPAGGKYILAGHWKSLRDLAKMVEGINGVRVPRLTFPMWLARIGAPFVTLASRILGKRTLFTTAALKPLRSNPRISHARATHELDYHPRPLRETLIDTLQWFEETGLLKRPLVPPNSIAQPKTDG